VEPNLFGHIVGQFMGPMGSKDMLNGTGDTKEKASSDMPMTDMPDDNMKMKSSDTPQMMTK
jgi:hypothetical protein